MKQLPIRYKEEFLPGKLFTPFSYTDMGERIYVDSMFVEIYFDSWNQGVCMIVEIYKKEFPENTKPRNTMIDKYVFHDKLVADNDYDIVVTMEQKQLMGCLFAGDIRGQYAENIVTSLFVDICLLNDRSPIVLARHLSDVVMWYAKTWEKFGIKRVSK